MSDTDWVGCTVRQNTGKLKNFNYQYIYLAQVQCYKKYKTRHNSMQSKNPLSKHLPSTANPKPIAHTRTLSTMPKQQPVPEQQTPKNMKHRQPGTYKFNTPKQINEDHQQNRKSNMLMSCRSFPNILLTNSYIKMDGVSMDGIGYEHMFNKLSTSTQKQRRKAKRTDLIRKNDDSFGVIIKERLDRAEKVMEKQCQQALKKPKFARKNTLKFQRQISLPAAISSSQSLVQNYTELVQQNSILKQKLLQSQQKISQLNIKIQSLSTPTPTPTVTKRQSQPSSQLSTLNLHKTKALQLQLQLSTTTSLLTQRTNQLTTLNTRIAQLQKNNAELNEKIKQLNQQIQKQKQKYICPENMFQGIQLQVQQFQKNITNSNGGNVMNSSGIMMDMLSTAEYIQSLTDLQDQLHNKKSQIFDLNKAIQQLKMKQHFIQLRNQQNIRRINDQWSNKYKRLLNMYKAIKASRNSQNSRMKKLKTKTEFIDQEKEDLFNLSLSTDRSQLPFN